VQVVEASVISFAVAVDESVETFTNERKQACPSELATVLSCFAPACHIEVVVVAGSLNLNIIVTVPETSDGSVGIAPAVVASTEQLLNPQSASVRLAAVFGATVISSSDSPTVQSGVCALVPTDAMLPSPSAYIASPPPSAGGDKEEKAGFPIFVVVGVGAGAAVCIAILVAYFVCFRRYRCGVTVHVRRDSDSNAENVQNPQGKTKTKIAADATVSYPNMKHITPAASSETPGYV
jgi:hypothetical protein